MNPGRLAASALVVVAASLSTTGCSHSSDYKSFEAACESQVGPAVVAEWQKTHDDSAPWNVTRIVSTKAKEGSESSSESKVVYVSGTAAVAVDESGDDARKVSWSCFSQRPTGSSKVFAAMRSVTTG
jgi:hypothetical protein